ncbi:hypothetical protein LXJ58_23395, partial [Escherichia coli]|nr:hypothetical protein [Escherichia coli]
SISWSHYPDLYLQILQYIEMHKTTLTDIIINDRESVLS